jgi:hypothetical protein
LSSKLSVELGWTSSPVVPRPDDYRPEQPNTHSSYEDPSEEREYPSHKVFTKVFSGVEAVGETQ